ncbi:MAG: hypothetical protein H0V51_11655, partial [Chloroflexi bacterium]|nr:hypothetical protein [Chloroflexota bacterium]
LTFSPRSPRAVLLAPAMAAAVAGIVVAAIGPLEVLNRIVTWRLAGQQLDPSWPGISHNVELLYDKMFRQEQPAFYALAAVGGLALLLRALQPGLALAGWLGAQLLLLLLYTELSAHLGVTLIGPLAVLAGVGLGAAWSLFSARRHRTIMTMAVSALAVLITVWYATAIPALLDRDQRLIAGLLSTDRDGGRDERAAVRVIGRLTAAEDFLLTDAPYLAFLSDRKVPPELVDPSLSRIRAGALTAEQVTASLQAYNPKLVVLWTGKLARFEPLMEILSAEWEPVEQYGTVDKGTPRAIYRRR